MKQIRFGSSAVPLRLEFPVEWDAAQITGVTLTVKDRDGAALMAADDLTLWTQTTLDGAVARYASSIVLNHVGGNPPDDLAVGDSLLILGTAGNEVHRVKGYGSSTHTAELEGIFENDHDDNDEVWGLFGTYSLDISDTDVFTNGIVLVLVWTPTGSGQAITEEVQVSDDALDLAGLRQDFADVFPRAYEAFTKPIDRFDRMVATAERRVTSRLEANQPPLDIQRIKDQNLAKDAVMIQLAILWTLNGDQQLDDERKVLKEELADQIEYLTSRAMWLDDDMDGEEDDDENAASEPTFTRSW